ncbi:hypothetical protein D3C77_567320 [compost metagenome]
MPGQSGPPTQLPTLARSSAVTPGSGAGASRLNLPAAHWPSRKYWVRVRVRNFASTALLTELEPEFSGIIGMPESPSKSWPCWPSVKPFAPGLRNSRKYAWRNSAVRSLASVASKGGGEKLLSAGTEATQR